MERPQRIPQVVVACDDEHMARQIEVCLFDRDVQAHVISWRDSLSGTNRSPDQDAVKRIASQQARLLAAAAEYVALARESSAIDGDTHRALEWAQEAVQRAEELNEGLRKIVE